MDVERLKTELEAGLRWKRDRNTNLVVDDYAMEKLLSQAAAALAKLQAERDEAREALRPFAEASRDCDDDLVSDGCSAWESSEANCVTIGHFRAASRALGGGE